MRHRESTLSRSPDADSDRRAPTAGAPIVASDDRPEIHRDLHALLSAQRTAFAAHPPVYSERLVALEHLQRVVVDHQQDFAAAISEDFGGRAVEETLALEVYPLVSEIRTARRQLRRWMAPRPARPQWPFWPAHARVLHQPLGVVGIVSSWNYPLFLNCAPLVAALAAGNHAMLKPSPLAPATADLLASLLGDVYPNERVAVVTGGTEVAADFVALPFDHLLFTGSTRVGRLVLQAAARNLVPVTLELGGKSPVIVHEDYLLERAAERIAAGKLFNAGQTCVAPDYVLLPRHRRDEFVRFLRGAIARMYPRLVDNPGYTRIVDAQHYRRLTELVEDAKRLGAEAIQVNPAGEACTAANRVFPPTLLLSVNERMTAMQEEIFGPVLPVLEYASLEEALAFVAARPHPLAFFYFDRNHRRGERIVSRVTAGGATVNDCVFHAGQVRLPFGGVGPSGMGRYHGEAGFRTFSNEKGVLFQPSWSAVSLLRPPYTDLTRRVLRLLIGG